LGARYANGYGSNAPGQESSLTGQMAQYSLPSQYTVQPGNPSIQVVGSNPLNGQTQMAGLTGSRYPSEGLAGQQQAGSPQVAQTASATPQSAVAPTTGLTGPSSRPPLGMDGYCPVTLKREQRWVPGDKQYGIVHRGRLYLFTGPAQAQQFWDNPDQFSPVLSGVDPVLALDNGATVQGQREHGVEFNGLVYLFSSESTLQHFSRNPERYAAGVRQAMQGTGGTALR
jgi:protein disulfide-isomerase